MMSEGASNLGVHEVIVVSIEQQESTHGLRPLHCGFSIDVSSDGGLSDDQRANEISSTQMTSQDS